MHGTRGKRGQQPRARDAVNPSQSPGPVNSAPPQGPCQKPPPKRSPPAARLARLLALDVAWAPRAALARIGLDPVRLGPAWFVRWETWKGAYYCATPWALERAGLVVDEADDMVPRYMAEAERPAVARNRRERHDQYRVDLDQLAAPTPPPGHLVDDEGRAVLLWGRKVQIDHRLARAEVRVKLAPRPRPGAGPGPTPGRRARLAARARRIGPPRKGPGNS